ncbi:MAG: small multi-drug export protein [Candidatus Omnitrophica bacterium]|nr:small multi-drug export protein [Candidatus Omnitrophota bacterium]
MSVIEKSGLYKSLWARAEGHILGVGIGLILMYVVWTGLSWMRSAEYCQKILSLTATRFVVGRPGGVYFGHVLGLNYGTNISVNMFVDAVAVFLLYPLFVFSIEHIFILRSLKNFIGRVHKMAQANYKIIKTYGLPGLFLFVLFPLWGTGPVVGCMIGFMMELRPWFNMSIVLGATFLAIIIWTVILAEFHMRLLAYSPYMPMIMIGVLFVIAIGVHLVRGMRHKN